MVMMMPVMMMSHRVCRNGQPTQDNQSYNSQKHGTNLHIEIPSSQPPLFQTVRSWCSLSSLTRASYHNVFLDTKMFHA